MFKKDVFLFKKILKTDFYFVNDWKEKYFIKQNHECIQIIPVFLDWVQKIFIKTFHGISIEKYFKKYLNKFLQKKSK